MVRRSFLTVMAWIFSFAATLGCANKIDRWSPSGVERRLDKGDTVFVLLPWVEVRGDVPQLSVLVGDSFSAQLGHFADVTGGKDTADELSAAGLRDMAPRFAAAVAHAAFVESSELIPPEYADVTAKLAPLFDLVRAKKPDTRWIAVIHIVEQPSPKDEQAFFEVIGGLYDIQQNTISAAVRFTRFADENKIGSALRVAGVDAAIQLVRPAEDTTPIEVPEGPQEPT